MFAVIWISVIVLSALQLWSCFRHTFFIEPWCICVRLTSSQSTWRTWHDSCFYYFVALILSKVHLFCIPQHPFLALTVSKLHILLKRLSLWLSKEIHKRKWWHMQQCGTTGSLTQSSWLMLEVLCPVSIGSLCQNTLWMASSVTAQPLLITHALIVKHYFTKYVWSPRSDVTTAATGLFLMSTFLEHRLMERLSKAVVKCTVKLGLTPGPSETL